jgi:RNA polymerase sigma factor FliA
MESVHVRFPRASASESIAPIAVSIGALMTDAGNRADTSWQNDGERERLLVEQLPQVRYIARRIHERLPRHVLLEDMVHAGVVGLIDAWHKFDGSKHVQFGSYAKFRIRGANSRQSAGNGLEPARSEAQGAPVGRCAQYPALRPGTRPQRN